MASKPKENMFSSISKQRLEKQDSIVDHAKKTAKEVVEAKAPVQENPSTPKKPSPKKTSEPTKAGRPKGKPSTKISLNVPDEYLEIVNIAAGINFKGNTSSYIVSLIENDIKENGKVYEQIKALTK